MAGELIERNFRPIANVRTLLLLESTSSKNISAFDLENYNFIKNREELY